MSFEVAVVPLTSAGVLDRRGDRPVAPALCFLAERGVGHDEVPFEVSLALRNEMVRRAAAGASDRLSEPALAPSRSTGGGMGRTPLSGRAGGGAR